MASSPLQSLGLWRGMEGAIEAGIPLMCAGTAWYVAIAQDAVDLGHVERAVAERDAARHAQSLGDLEDAVGAVIHWSEGDIEKFCETYFSL